MHAFVVWKNAKSIFVKRIDDRLAGQISVRRRNLHARDSNRQGLTQPIDRMKADVVFSNNDAMAKRQAEDEQNEPKL